MAHIARHDRNPKTMPRAGLWESSKRGTSAESEAAEAEALAGTQSPPAVFFVRIFLLLSRDVRPFPSTLTRLMSSRNLRSPLLRPRSTSAQAAASATRTERLLRQPGGFEGFGRAFEALAPDDLPV